MTYGEQVAEKVKNQYYDESTGKWARYSFWSIQPEGYYKILLELKSKEAIDTLFGHRLWTRRLKKPKREPRRFWVNLYPDCKPAIHFSKDLAIENQSFNCSGTIEVVEVLKNDEK